MVFILPMSENGHISIFNDFSARYSGVAPEVTGLVHIGMAIGILAMFYKVFIQLTFDFFSVWTDVFKKKFNPKKITNRRKFMMYTFIPYIFMLLYPIPVGEKGNIFDALHSVAYDGNLLTEGIFFIISALMLFFASFMLSKSSSKGKQLSLPAVLVISVLMFFAVPMAGISLSAIVICIAVFFGANKNIAVRYFAAVSVPVLIVSAIVEIVKCTVYVNVLTGIIAVVLAGVASYFVCVLLKLIVKNNGLKYFSYYNAAIGVIIAIIGIVEIVVK